MEIKSDAILAIPFCDVFLQFIYLFDIKFLPEYYCTIERQDLLKLETIFEISQYMLLKKAFLTITYINSAYMSIHFFGKLTCTVDFSALSIVKF